MSYTSSWYLDKRIVYTRVQGDLTPEEALTIGEKHAEFLREGDRPIYIVVDVAEMKKFPTNILQIKQASAYLSDPALGWVILVGGSTLTTSFANIITQLTGSHFRGFRTLKAALQFLEAEDPTLEGLAERSAEG